MTLIFTLWLSINALASVADAQFSMILQTISIEDLHRAVRDRGAIETLARDCALQRELKRVPVACFAEIGVMRSHRLITAVEFERRVRGLSNLCRQAVRASNEFDLLRAALRSDTLSESCHKAVSRRVEDLDYQIGEVRSLDRFLK